MYLDEGHRWSEILGTGRDERPIAKLTEIFVAMGGIVVRDDDLLAVSEAQPARIKPPVTASAQ
jgi:hypothetical protein